MYTEQLIDHFNNPRNVGCFPDADGIGTIGDPDCGDFIRIYIRVKNNRISEIVFEACGCPASIATTSVLTVLAEDKTLDQAFSISEMDIVRALGGLPDPKIHCSNLGAAALRQATGQSGTDGLLPIQKQIYDYIKDNKMVTRDQVVNALNIPDWELEKQIAVLRHCELVKGKKVEGNVYLVLFNE
ncbi:MAG: iron-sulfur cluster assembly scaffold protein [Firmicutes bacterium]|nr:iron-sulfur cluster assembly scaffold protein [Bacillota bacterium]